MSIIQIYFILGLAMFLAILWDYKVLPETARRLTKQPKQSGQTDENNAGFSRIALESRNFAIVAVFVFFLWPIAVYWEITGAKKQ